MELPELMSFVGSSGPSGNRGSTNSTLSSRKKRDVDVEEDSLHLRGLIKDDDSVDTEDARGNQRKWPKCSSSLPFAVAFVVLALVLVFRNPKYPPTTTVQMEGPLYTGPPIDLIHPSFTEAPATLAPALFEPFSQPPTESPSTRGQQAASGGTPPPTSEETEEEAWTELETPSQPPATADTAASLSAVAGVESQQEANWLPPSTLEVISTDPRSPQATAFQWVEGHSGYATMPTWRKQQLMALASLYFSTKGLTHWPKQSLWMQPHVHECDWITHGKDETMGLFFRKKPTCSSEGALVALALDTSGLQGNLPPEIGLLAPATLTSLEFRHMTSLQGPLPSEVGLLTQLTRLSLDHNGFTGCLPPQLFGMTNLHTLYLDDNFFACTIPEISAMPALVLLDLDGNQLQGTIPTTLGRLTALHDLNLSYNNFTGTLPSQLANLANALEAFYVGHVNLKGTLPSALFALTKLTSLELKKTHFTGTIPPQGLAKLSQLQVLSLFDNDLQGPLPTTIGVLTNLEILYGLMNLFTGSLPSELGLLSKLNTLWLRDNRFTGQLPSQLGRMTAMALLDLSSNDITGELPPQLGLMRHILTLDLHNNSLVGSIPPSVCDLPDLSSMALDCSDNKVNCDCSSISTNFLPADTLVTVTQEQSSPQTAAFRWLIGHPEYKTMPFWRKRQLMALSTLYYSTGGPAHWSPNTVWMDTSMHECDWTVHRFDEGTGGYVTTKMECTPEKRYASLAFAKSGLAGTIPTELALLSSSLTVLELREMKELQGTIPSELGTLTNLVELKLDRSSFTGCVPPELLDGRLSKLVSIFLNENLLQCVPAIGSSMPSLKSLKLSGNQFSGAVPGEIGFMTSLTELDLGANRFSGSFPSQIGNLANTLTELWLGKNTLRSTLPPSLFGLRQLTSLDLKMNQITGTLPANLSQLFNLEMLSLFDGHLQGPLPTTIGSLTSLKHVYLLNNRFSGSLPSELGLLSAHTATLQLGVNSFSGPIPKELGRMTTLTSLSLHSNLLTGSVPEELGNLINLQSLALHNNSLVGTLPDSICLLPNLGDLQVDCDKITCEAKCVPCKCKA
jgi:Leucine-rich repeat (LRR) protein